MTKDFQASIDMGICTKEKALRLYVTSQSVFFPPHPQYIVESTVEGFKKYWNGTISLEVLRQKCYLRNVNALYKYYGEFL